MKIVESTKETIDLSEEMSKIDTKKSLALIQYKSKEEVLAVMGDLNTQLNDMVEKCYEIDVKDDESFEILKARVTALNKQKAAIDKYGKVTRDPYTKSAKLIKAAIDGITEKAQATITELKEGKLLEWENMKLAEDAIREHKLKEEQNKKLVEVQKIAAVKQGILAEIIEYLHNAKTEISEAKTLKELNDVGKKYIVEYPAPVNLIICPEYQTNWDEAKSDVLKLGSTKKTLLKTIAEGDTETISKLSKSMVEQEADMTESGHDSIEQANDENLEDINSIGQEAIANATLGVRKTNKISYSYQFEIFDKAKVDTKYLILDVIKFRRALEENDELPKETSIVGGVTITVNKKIDLR